MIGQPLTHAAPSGLTEYSTTRWNLDDNPESLAAEVYPDSVPESSLPDQEVEIWSRSKRSSEGKRKHRSQGKKRTSKDIDRREECDPCHSSGKCSGIQTLRVFND